MRDYIILNGIRSTLVRGLMICKLPPITKPAIRTTTTTIDGRDGDIVTPLGYQSYDKEIEIGLYGDYDVDEVIKYFDSAGTVTFSNEITKFYNYRIDNQIDFEKLIRFRTAKVTLHVQPFKYSTTELPLEWESIRPIYSMPGYNNSLSKNGILIITDNNGATLKMSGTATADTALYIPISRLALQPGIWEFDVKASALPPNEGSIGASDITMRLIMDTPTDADTFGEAFQLVDDATAYVKDSFSPAARVYNYLYMAIPEGSAVNLAITPTVSALDNLAATSTDERKILRGATNSGNTIARPKFAITGVGSITLKIGVGENPPTYTVDLTGTSGTITIDAEAQDAYEGTTLRNRNVTGDYSKMVLQPGPNRIEATATSTIGKVTKIEVENYSRWT